MNLTFQNVTKIFSKNIRIIDNMSFDLKGPDTIALLGPNGSGKSTIMKLLVNMINPTKGHIFINGVDVQRDREAALKNISALVEYPHPYKGLTIRELTNFVLKIKDARQEELGSLAKVFEISNFEMKLFELSKGFFWRVMLLCTFIGDYEILILDEPFSGLDPLMRIKFIDILKNEGKKKLIFFSTHNVYNASILSDKIMLIDNGRIITTESTKKLISEIGIRKLTVEFTKEVKEDNIKKIDSDILDVRKIDTTIFEITFKSNIEEKVIRNLTSLGLKSIKEAENSLNLIYKSVYEG